MLTNELTSSPAPLATTASGRFYPLDPRIEGCDVPGWLRYMTAAELDLDGPKLVEAFATGEIYVSCPSGPEGSGRRDGSTGPS